MVGQTYQRRASLATNQITGQGKCTVEVVVDGVVDVSIRGDSGSLRNLSGQPPQWRRFECTSRMPNNPADFRFTGVDGRGRQQLIQDPRNGGVAVIRLEDTQGGAEAYTFDITWSSGQGGYYDQGPISRNSQPQWGNGGQYGNSDAMRACQDAVRQEAARRFNSSDVNFQRMDWQDNRGPRDQIIGAFTTGRGWQSHDFSCAVNTASGRLQSVRIDPNGYNSNGRNAPVYGDRGAVSNTQAMRACERAVTDRIRRDGYGSVQLGQTAMRGDRVVGSARADRGNRTDPFDFSCAVDFNSGTVQSVDVNRR